MQPLNSLVNLGLDEQLHVHCEDIAEDVNGLNILAAESRRYARRHFAEVRCSQFRINGLEILSLNAWGHARR